MSETAGFSDLQYSEYPAVESDERYEFRNLQLDDIDAVNMFQSLMANVQTAATSTDRSVAWQALQDFMATDDYANHVYPVVDVAEKWQKLHDTTIACQRVALKKTQPWVISETQPEDGAQVINDLWYKAETLDNNATHHTIYQKTSNGYIEVSLVAKLEARIAELEKRLNALTEDVTIISAVDTLPATQSNGTLYLVTEQ